MAKLLKIVDDHKASKWLRLANYVIDLAIGYAAVVIIFALLGVFYALISGTDFYTVSEEMSQMNNLLDRILSVLTYALVMFLIEFLSKGRSIGKLITGTQVVRTDASKLKIQHYFLRNICRAMPFDQLSFLGENGWHDTIIDTRVVKKREFEEAIKLQSDLNSLGNHLDSELPTLEKAAVTFRKI